MSNINDFLSSFKDTELARPCNFDVTILPTSVNLISALTLAAAKAGRDPISSFNDIKFRCEASELPSRVFTAATQKIYGPETLIPIQTIYNRINLTFICSDDMFERWLFESWMNYMSNASFFPFPNSVGQIADMFESGGRPIVNYDFEYRNNYECFILITQYNIKGDPSYYVGLFHAFPIGINENVLGWNRTDEYHRVTVTFAYTYYNSAISLGDSGFPMI